MYTIVDLKGKSLSGSNTNIPGTFKHDHPRDVCPHRFNRQGEADQEHQFRRHEEG